MTTRILKQAAERLEALKPQAINNPIQERGPSLPGCAVSMFPLALHPSDCHGGPCTARPIRDVTKDSGVQEVEERGSDPDFEFCVKSRMRDYRNTRYRSGIAIAFVGRTESSERVTFTLSIKL